MPMRQACCPDVLCRLILSSWNQTLDGEASPPPFGASNGRRTCQCFNQHNEASEGNEKHRVPFWQCPFTGTVCSKFLPASDTICEVVSICVWYRATHQKQTTPRMQGLCDQRQFCSRNMSNVFLRVSMHVNSFRIVLEGASKICLILLVFLRALCCIFSAGAGRTVRGL